MKSFIILTLIALTTAEWSLKTQDEWLKIREDCNTRFNVPNELIEKSKNDKYPPKEVLQNVLCYLKGLEIWNDSDGFLVHRIMIGLENVAKTIENYNAKLLQEGLKRCINQNSEGTTTFDGAYRCFKCFIDNTYLFEALKKTSFYQE